jgi:hypothetical protein
VGFLSFLFSSGLFLGLASVLAQSLAASLASFAVLFPFCFASLFFQGLMACSDLARSPALLAGIEGCQVAPPPCGFRAFFGSLFFFPPLLCVSKQPPFSCLMFVPDLPHIMACPLLAAEEEEETEVEASTSVVW